MNILILTKFPNQKFSPKKNLLGHKSNDFIDHYEEVIWLMWFASSLEISTKFCVKWSMAGVPNRSAARLLDFTNFVFPTCPY